MSVLKITCALCRGPVEFEPPTGDLQKSTCQRCGTYSIDGSTEAVLTAGPTGAAHRLGEDRFDRFELARSCIR